MTKALVLHSGGLDSTVCLLLALEQGLDVVSFGVDYGQTHRIELDYAAMQCKRFGVERRISSVRWTKPERVIPRGRQKIEIGKEISPAFLPARNGVFLMLATAEAAGVAANEIWIGTNSIDFSGYPDATPAFIGAFRKLLRVGVPNGPKIVSPLQRKSKRFIADTAKRLGLNETDTWSCYRPSIGTAGLSPCGLCDACILHAHAWE
jgi:7-cyano-7-deazaguanine synthase